jgi:hypothetical protein
MMRGSVKTRLIVLAIAVVLVAGCGNGAAMRDDSAANLMPNVPGFSWQTTLDLQDTIAKIAGVASLAAAQPEITAVITAASSLARCYQEAGAVEGRVYTRDADPLQAGLIIIINRNQLTDPALLSNCIFGGDTGARIMVEQAIQPCANVYSLPRDNNEFYIAYVGTDSSVCAEFCSSLQGCAQ